MYLFTHGNNNIRITMKYILEWQIDASMHPNFKKSQHLKMFPFLIFFFWNFNLIWFMCHNNILYMKVEDIPWLENDFHLDHGLILISSVFLYSFYHFTIILEPNSNYFIKKKGKGEFIPSVHYFLFILKESVTFYLRGWINLQVISS